MKCPNKKAATTVLGAMIALTSLSLIVACTSQRDRFERMANEDSRDGPSIINNFPISDSIASFESTGTTRRPIDSSGSPVLFKKCNADADAVSQSEIDLEEGPHLETFSNSQFNPYLQEFTKLKVGMTVEQAKGLFVDLIWGEAKTDGVFEIYNLIEKKDPLPASPVDWSVITIWFEEGGLHKARYNWPLWIQEGDQSDDRFEKSNEQA